LQTILKFKSNIEIGKLHEKVIKSELDAKTADSENSDEGSGEETKTKTKKAVLTV